MTYEFENVPVEAARAVAPLPPPLALELGQDRLVEKRLFQRLGIPTARFGSLADSGLPALVKSRRLGYDGKGQRRVALDEELGEHELAEEIVPFDRELSIIAVRGRDGETRFWPLAENVHRDGILRFSRSPAAGAPQAEAEDLVRRLLEELEYVGVLALELFEVDGRLLANEFAPRVHNTGHWTIDGAVTSQFENHLRAILGLPLGATDAIAPAVMLNLIGGVPASEKLLRASGRAPPPLRQGTAARSQDRPSDADRCVRGDGRGGDCARRGIGGRLAVSRAGRRCDLRSCARMRGTDAGAASSPASASSCRWRPSSSRQLQRRRAR